MSDNERTVSDDLYSNIEDLASMDSLEEDDNKRFDEEMRELGYL